ncbi:MAG: hypothetical protein C0617_04790 [Desulfuromonas sp.]|uniref:hypothetical protein n=1 Tax=Desulfuromonas sp. TaxID=892 RepID=UPI000CB34256|nr:hypothetical protein [Desulfuromonas sp.]PLX85388.1 MAG: hypothetical protein C0617_04790 [Desulfuromonas sp.]
MEYTIDVEALRKQFHQRKPSCKQDAELVPLLFGYLEDIAKNKAVTVSQKLTLHRRGMFEAFGAPMKESTMPALFKEILFAADNQLKYQHNKLRPIPASSREICKRLRGWLRAHAKEGTLPLNQFGYLSVNEMAKAINVKNSRNGWNKTFRRHVERVDRILAKLPTHPDNSPYVANIDKHKRFYSFEKYRPLDSELILEIVEVFKKEFESKAKATTQNSFFSICAFLEFWIEQASNGAPGYLNISRKLMDGEKPNHEEMEMVLTRFREHVLHSGMWTGGVLQNYFGNINRLFRALDREGVLPKPIDLKQPGRGWKANKNNRPKKSLAEVPATTFSEKELKKIVEPLLEKNVSSDEIVEATKNDFLKTLAADGFDITASQEEHLKHIADLTEKRLSSLRRCAEDELLKWYETYQAGQKLLKSCDLSYEKGILPLIEEWLQASNRSNTKLARILYRNQETPKDVALSRYLCLIENRWNGILPTSQHWELHSFNKEFFMSVASRTDILPMMQPHKDAYVAAMVILLVDTGGNVDSINDLPYPCLQDTDDPNEKILSTWKPRAGHALIQEIVQVNDRNRISSVRAIEMIEEMTSRLRRMAKHGPTGPFQSEAYGTHRDSGLDKVHNHLFISRLYPSKPMRVFNKATRTKSFKKLLKRHSELEKIAMKMEFIRSTIILDATIKKEGRLLVGQTIANHKHQDTTSGYNRKYTQSIMAVQSIRKFQNLLEAILITDIKNGYKALGMSKEKWEEALSEAHRTGLGVMCLNPKAGVQPGTQEGTQCDKLESCHSCKSMFIPATVENIKDMILFSQYLQEHSDDLAATSPADWENIWLPYMTLHDTALAKLMKGGTSGVYQEALTEVEGAKFAGIPSAI